MASTNGAPSHPASLVAVYNSPHSTQTFARCVSSPVPNPSQGNVKSKVAYLAELRTLVPTLQNDINVFLTARMEDDKKAAEAQGRQVSEKEAKEEANYGEEVVEDDA